MRVLMTTLWLALASGAALAEGDASVASHAVEREAVATEAAATVEAATDAAGNAAKAPGKGQGSKRHRREMMDKLDLSNEQRAQIIKVRSEGGKRDEVRAILTPEQAEKFDQLRAERKANKGKGHKGKQGKKGKPAPEDEGEDS